MNANTKKKDLDLIVTHINKNCDHLYLKKLYFPNVIYRYIQKNPLKTPIIHRRNPPLNVEEIPIILALNH